MTNWVMLWRKSLKINRFIKPVMPLFLLEETQGQAVCTCLKQSWKEFEWQGVKPKTMVWYQLHNSIILSFVTTPKGNMENPMKKGTLTSLPQLLSTFDKRY